MTVAEMTSLGGKARAAALTPERRAEIARAAVAARERKRISDMSTEEYQAYVARLEKRYDPSIPWAELVRRQRPEAPA